MSSKKYSINCWKEGDSRSITHKFTEADVKVFAELTGDKNPLHIDKNFAETSAAGGQVVHGMLAASFISTLIGEEIPGHGALWNDFQINWRKMIRIDDAIKFTAKISTINFALETINLDIDGVGLDNNLLYLNGSARVSIMSKKKMINSPLLKGKKILVTGASGVLGSAVCKLLSNNGAELILWGRSNSNLDLLNTELEDSVVETICCDLLDKNAVKKQSKKIFSSFEIYGIVHTAAAPLLLIDSASEDSLEELRKHMEVEVFSLQRLVADFKQNLSIDEGFITAVLSEAVFDSPPANMSAYVTAKTALWGMMKTYAKELGVYGVRCNSVSPGLMETPYSSEISIRAKKIEEATNPLRRICSPEDVAQAILFLATSSFINGANLPLTGGQRMP
jgi:3-oxoacyl-[acyl-carrier protein] reductase